MKRIFIISLLICLPFFLFAENYAIINENIVNIRDNPNLDGNVTFQLNKNDRIEIIGQSDHTTRINKRENIWYNIKDAQGRSGWIFADLVSRLISETIPEGIFLSSGNPIINPGDMGMLDQRYFYDFVQPLTDSNDFIEFKYLDENRLRILTGQIVGSSLIYYSEAEYNVQFQNHDESFHFRYGRVSNIEDINIFPITRDACFTSVFQTLYTVQLERIPFARLLQLDTNKGRIGYFDYCLENMGNLNDQEVINMLNEIPVEILDKRGQILSRAISCENYDAVDLLIEKGVKIINQDQDTTSLIYHQALDAGYFPLIKYCIESGTNINRNTGGGEMSTSPLYIAIDNCDIEVIEYLLANGINVQSYNQEYGYYKISPLIRAISQKKSLELIELLINYGADINENCSIYYYNNGIDINNITYHSCPK